MRIEPVGTTPVRTVEDARKAHPLIQWIGKPLHKLFNKSWIMSVAEAENLKMPDPDDQVIKAPDRSTHPEYYQTFSPEQPKLNKKDLEETKELFQAFIETLKSDEFDDHFNFDDLYLALMNINSNLQEENVEVTSQLLHTLRQQMRSMSKARIQKLQEIADRLGRLESFKKLEVVLATVGVSAAALSISGPIGVVVTVVALGLAADSLCHDPVKKEIAHLISLATSLLAKDVDEERVEENAFYSLCVAAMIVNLAGAAAGGIFAASSSGIGFIGAAINLLKGVTTGGMAYTEFKSTREQNHMYELSCQHENDSNHRSELLDALKNYIEVLARANEQKRKSIERHLETQKMKIN